MSVENDHDTDEEDDHFIVHELLAMVAELIPDSAPIIHYERMKPEHVSRLLKFPTLVTAEMASIFDRERATLLLQRGRVTDQTGNLESLGHVAKEFLGKSKFLECPLFPPADKNRLFATLLVAMATYILFCKVLTQHLENGETDQIIKWSGNWGSFPPDGRFDATVSLMWLGKMIGLALLRQNEALNAANLALMRQYEASDSANNEESNEEFDEEFTFPYVPLPVVTVLKGNGDPNADEDTLPAYCYLVGLHPEDEEGNPKEYILWTVFYETDDGSIDGSIEFQFKPLWNIEEVPFRKKLCELLLLIERDVRVTFVKLRDAWEDFAGKLEDYASKDEFAANQMMNKFIDIDYLVDASFEYPAFRKSVAVLDWTLEKNDTLKDVSKKYKKSKKQHVTPEMIDSLRAAVPAILDLWKKIRENTKIFDSKKVSDYVRANRDRFFFTDPKDIANRGERYHAERNGKRNFIIDSLVTVSARRGNELSKVSIAKLLDSEQIYIPQEPIRKHTSPQA